MKIALVSDLHHEWGDWLPSEAARSADVVILAGDVEHGTLGIQWASRSFPGQTVVYVAGNHEFYRNSLDLVEKLREPEWKAHGVHFLERSVLELPGVRILGATLWSGFSLHGGGEAQQASMATAQERINDYWDIRVRDEGPMLTPSDTLAAHEATVTWLDQALAQPYEGKTVVVTHFPPLPQCVHPEMEGTALAPYYATDLSWLMEKYPIDLWCHGHTHSNTDFLGPNGCHILSNHRGYPGQHTGDKEGEQQGKPSKHPFRPDLVVTL